MFYPKQPETPSVRLIPVIPVQVVQVEKKHAIVQIAFNLTLIFLHILQS